ncbi:MAG: MFS transporter, partial [Actinomycetota bacterium]
STVDVASGYGLVAASIAVIGAGMGFTMAPATESIIGSLPLAKAGVGSAMNDTTRMVGGALGVAVLGSVLASSYGSAIEPALRGAPAPVAAVAGDSIGGAATIAAQLGAQGQAILDAARAAYVEGMGHALLVGAGVAALGAILVLLFLPARARREDVAPSEATRARGRPALSARS